jgi:hypothetical protein
VEGKGNGREGKGRVHGDLDENGKSDRIDRRIDESEKHTSWGLVHCV